MARPIAETPILFDLDAERFQHNMENVQPASREEMERCMRSYEWMKSIATFPM